MSSAIEPLIIIKQGVGGVSIAVGTVRKFLCTPPGLSARYVAMCASKDRKTKPKEKDNVEKMLGTDQPMKLVLCDCGGLRLTSGAMTIHFSREEFQVFAAAVGRLASIVAQPPLGQASKATRANVSEVCH